MGGGSVKEEGECGLRECEGGGGRVWEEGVWEEKEGCGRRREGEGGGGGVWEEEGDGI